MSAYKDHARFIVPGKPTAKQRPRMTRSGMVYTPQQTINYENHVKVCYMDQVGCRIEGDRIKARIIAVYQMPKSVSKKKKIMMLEGLIRPKTKPDLDNIAKSILDALNSIAYRDDSIITELEVSKWYGEEPEVQVELWGTTE